jgi:hypothetical protein
MRNLSAKQGMATFLGVCLVIFFPMLLMQIRDLRLQEMAVAEI